MKRAFLSLPPSQLIQQLIVTAVFVAIGYTVLTSANGSVFR